MKKTLTYRKLKLIQQLMAAEKRFLGAGGDVCLVTQEGYLIDKYGLGLDPVQARYNGYVIGWHALYKAVNKAVNGMELVDKPEMIECEHMERAMKRAEYVLANLPLLAHIEAMLKELK